MYGVLNALSEFTYFYTPENVTSYPFLLIFKLAKSFQCILQLDVFVCFKIDFLKLYFLNGVERFFRSQVN